MSTKIHHGWRAPREVDPFDLIAEAEKALTPVRRRLDAVLLVDKAVASLDNDVMYGRDLQTSQLLDTFYAFEKEQKELNPNVRLHDPNRADLTVLRDWRSGDLALLLDTEHQEVRDAFATVSGVQHYPYWNNTDRPDDLTARQWTDRKRFWERTLERPRGQGARGLTWKVHPDVRGYMIDLVINAQPGTDAFDLLGQALPDRQQRARRLASTAMADAALHADSGNHGRIMRALMRPAPDDLLAKLDRLVLDLTVENLLTDPPTVPEWMDEARMQVRERARAIEATIEAERGRW